MRHVEGLHTGAIRASWSAASVTAEAKRFPRGIAGGLDAAAEAGEDDPTRVITEETPSRRADAGIAWCTLVHGLLEHSMRHASATRDDLRRLAMWLTVEEPGLRAVIDRALDTVDAVKGAAFWQAANASPESHEEAPFAVREIADGLPKVVNGTVDLVYRLGDGWQIVDYKTDADVASADLAARYALQIEAYGRAWGKVSGAPVASSVVAARETPAEGDGMPRTSGRPQGRLFD